MQKLAVVGSRSFNDYAFLSQVLDRYRQRYGEIEIITGGADGADTLAERYATEHHLVLTVFPADWTNLSAPDAVIRMRRDGTQYDARAGLRRNLKIVAACDVLIAFWDGSSTGTRHSIKYARKEGKTVYVFINGRYQRSTL